MADIPIRSVLETIWKARLSLADKVDDSPTLGSARIDFQSRVRFKDPPIRVIDEVTPMPKVCRPRLREVVPELPLR